MLVKATLTHMATLESFPVLWNPKSYTVSRSHRFASPSALSAHLSPLRLSVGGTERFFTRLFLDSSDQSGPERNLRGLVDRLERWSEVQAGNDLPPRLLFSWGSFRFRGYVEALSQEWIRFDADGTPVRAWLDLTLRR
jgi:hypothetical protein